MKFNFKTLLCMQLFAIFLWNDIVCNKSISNPILYGIRYSLIYICIYALKNGISFIWLFKYPFAIPSRFAWNGAVSGIGNHRNSFYALECYMKAVMHLLNNVLNWSLSHIHDINFTLIWKRLQYFLSLSTRVVFLYVVARSLQIPLCVVCSLAERNDPF